MELQPMVERTLAVQAGPCRLAIPLTSVRQILDAGGETASAPEDPRALGVAPTSLARVLDLQPAPGRPALLLFDSHLGPVLISVCRLDGIVDAHERFELPATAPIRWPGLLSHGILAPIAAGAVPELDAPPDAPTAPSPETAAGVAAFDAEASFRCARAWIWPHISDSKNAPMAAAY